MSPKAASLGLKTTKVKKRFFVLEEGVFFVDMFFGVFQWKNKLEFKHVFCCFPLEDLELFVSMDLCHIN